MNYIGGTYDINPAMFNCHKCGKSTLLCDCVFFTNAGTLNYPVGITLDDVKKAADSLKKAVAKPAAKIPPDFLAAAQLAFRFLAGLQLTDHSIETQRELRSTVELLGRELAKANGREWK